MEGFIAANEMADYGFNSFWNLQRTLVVDMVERSIVVLVVVKKSKEIIVNKNDQRALVPIKNVISNKKAFVRKAPLLVTISI